MKSELKGEEPEKPEGEEKLAEAAKVWGSIELFFTDAGLCEIRTQGFPKDWHRGLQTFSILAAPIPLTRKGCPPPPPNNNCGCIL